MVELLKGSTFQKETETTQASSQSSSRLSTRMFSVSLKSLYQRKVLWLLCVRYVILNVREHSSITKYIYLSTQLFLFQMEFAAASQIPWGSFIKGRQKMSVTSGFMGLGCSVCPKNFQ